MSIFNYLEIVCNSNIGIVVFRFLQGAAMNLDKLSKSFIHQMMPKEYRQKALFLQSVSYTVGTLLGPFFGLTFFDYFQDVKPIFTIISILFVFSAIMTLVCFTQATKKKKKKLLEGQEPEVAVEEENISYKKHGTVVVYGWKEMLKHCFIDNRIARSIIYIYLVNASIFHVELVMTSNFLLSFQQGEKYSEMKHLIAYGNIIGGFGSLFTIWYLNKLDKSPKLYFTYMILTISVSILTTLASPFIR